MKKILFLFIVLLQVRAWGIEGIYIGAEGGFQSSPMLSATSSSLGFSGDIGFRVNSQLDVVLHSQLSNYSPPNLNLLGQLVTANWIFSRLSDFEMAVGAGPGIYFFNSTPNSTKFGIHFEAHADILMGETIRMGVGAFWHGLLGPDVGQTSYFSVLARLGLFFPIGY
jgi:hypothetical protein